MPDIEQIRRRREAEARQRDEQLRAERKKQEDRERERYKQDLERRRWQEMAKAKQDAKKEADVREAEMKSLQMRAQLGDQDAIDKLEEIRKNLQGPNPFVGTT